MSRHSEMLEELAAQLEALPGIEVGFLLDREYDEKLLELIDVKYESEKILVQMGFK